MATKVKTRPAAPNLPKINAVDIVRDDHGRPLYALVRYAEFLQLAGDVDEDAEDIAAAEAALADPNRVPAEVVNRIANGENTLKVIREWRGLTQDALGRATRTTKAHISQLETGRRSIGRKTAYAFAPALKVSPDVLMD